MSDTLASFGHEVHIVTYPFGDDLELKLAHIHRIPNIGWSRKISVGPTLQKPLLDLLMVFLACRLIWKYRCDVIHAHNYEGALVGICAKLVTWRPLLYNAVNSMSDELAGYNFIRPAFLARWLARALDWFVPRIPDQITTVSAELEKELCQWGIPAEKITVVPAGVVPEMFEGETDPAGFRQALGVRDEPIVLYTGTLDPFQRVDYLLEAFALLGPEYSDALLLMVCPFTKPTDRRALDEQAANLGITDRIRWVESHPLQDIFHYLALANVAVSPRPQCPGHPVKLLNYMGAGLPIVVAAGAAKGIRHLENGFVCQDHDPADMAAGIATLLRDRETAHRLGAAAAQTLRKNYDWRILCRKIETVYRRMIGPQVAELAQSPISARSKSS